MTIVLLVEDDDALRRALGRALALTFDVRSCASGREGLRRLNSEPIDVLLTDLGLPDVGGEDLAMAARTLRRPVGVVVMSADSARLEGGRALADAVLDKPSSLETMSATIRHAADCAKRAGAVRVLGRPDRLPSDV